MFPERLVPYAVRLNNLLGKINRNRRGKFRMWRQGKGGNGRGTASEGEKEN